MPRSTVQRRKSDAQWLERASFVVALLAIGAALAGWSAGVRLVPIELAILALVLFALAQRARRSAVPRATRAAPLDTTRPSAPTGPSHRHALRPARDHGARPPASP